MMRLQLKIFRDILENRASLIAIIAVCALGVALFSGINLYVASIEDEIEDNCSKFNLADFWIYKQDANEDDISLLASLPEVESAERRKMAEATCSNGISGTLRIHANDANPRINALEVVEGEAFDASASSSLWLDIRFAEENNLNVYDKLTLSIGEQQKEWMIRGLVRNAEYIYYAPDGLTVPEYKEHGFAYTGASILDMPFNEIVVSLHEGPTHDFKSLSVFKKKVDFAPFANSINSRF
jgi:putative ABC transport system permease protein